MSALASLFPMDCLNVAKKVPTENVKIRSDLLQKARAVTAIRGQKIQDYISSILVETIERDFISTLTQAIDEARPAPKSRK